MKFIRENFAQCENDDEYEVYKNKRVLLFVDSILLIIVALALACHCNKENQLNAICGIAISIVLYVGIYNMIFALRHRVSDSASDEDKSGHVKDINMIFLFRIIVSAIVFAMLGMTLGSDITLSYAFDNNKKCLSGAHICNLVSLILCAIGLGEKHAQIVKLEGNELE